ncbi:MAG: hypothetical protein GTO40_15135 [Deltaproteobacteria bacterium]|nr:hypothetical protein [Deltaproteobacteria bacterium]
MKLLQICGLIVILALTIFVPVEGRSGFDEETERNTNRQEVTLDVRKPLLSALLTTFNIPFRGLLCVSDFGMAYITMGASAGRRYSQAADFIEQGCEGPWILTPSRIRAEQQKVEKLKGAAFTEYDQW